MIALKVIAFFASLFFTIFWVEDVVLNLITFWKRYEKFTNPDQFISLDIKLTLAIIVLWSSFYLLQLL
jgi:hypothetical protein